MSTSAIGGLVFFLICFCIWCVALVAVIRKKRAHQDSAAVGQRTWPRYAPWLGAAAGGGVYSLFLLAHNVALAISGLAVSLGLAAAGLWVRKRDNQQRNGRRVQS
jgi:predicted phage tail protein